MFHKLGYNLIVAYLGFVFPVVSFAQDVCTDDENNPVVCNPLKDDSITKFLERVVDVLVTLSIPVIAVAIIYSGFLFITAGGNKDKIEKAKDFALYTLIGAGIIIGAEVIITVLENTASGLGVDGI